MVVPADEGLELTPVPSDTVDSREATVRSAAVMSGGTLLSRVTGLLRVTVTLAALGFTVVSDSYNAANTTPNIIYELVLGGILGRTGRGHPNDPRPSIVRPCRGSAP